MIRGATQSTRTVAMAALSLTLFGCQREQAAAPPQSPATASPATAIAHRNALPIAVSGPAQRIDYQVLDARGDTLLSGQSFFSDDANHAEVEQRDGSNERSLHVEQLRSRGGPALLLSITYVEQAHETNKRIAFRPVVRLAEKGPSEVTVKLASGEERRFVFNVQ